MKRPIHLACIAALSLALLATAGASGALGDSSSDSAPSG